MITEIIHISNRSKQVNHGTTTDDTRRDVTFKGKYSPLASVCWRIAYLLGDSKPRYPVPATTGQVYLFDDYVCLMPADFHGVMRTPPLFECWRDD